MHSNYKKRPIQKLDFVGLFLRVFKWIKFDGIRVPLIDFLMEDGVKLCAKQKALQQIAVVQTNSFNNGNDQIFSVHKTLANYIQVESK